MGNGKIHVFVMNLQFMKYWDDRLELCYTAAYSGPKNSSIDKNLQKQQYGRIVIT